MEGSIDFQWDLCCCICRRFSLSFSYTQRRERVCTDGSWHCSASNRSSCCYLYTRVVIPRNDYLVRVVYVCCVCIHKSIDRWIAVVVVHSKGLSDGFVIRWRRKEKRAEEDGKRKRVSSLVSSAPTTAPRFYHEILRLLRSFHGHITLVGSDG